MSGSLIISLDFELMWGVRDHRTVQDYGDAILGGRKAIPKILSRFQKNDIRATWATVGLLFAKNREEMLEFAPRRRPAYENAKLSPYEDIENGVVGKDENEDRFHFGASLIEQIAETPGQEIATHTYSHYYCMEPGAEVNTFAADLTAASSIAAHNGHNLKSIVYPRNQATEEFIEQGAKLQVETYRGDAKGWLYRHRSGHDTTKLFRLVRFLDGAIPLGSDQVIHPSRNLSTINVPASRFLRPWSNRLAIYHLLHIRRIKAEMELAARSGGCYHLWWHPHNFGRNLEANLHQLDKVIECFKHCRDKYGMDSRNMLDFAAY